jgi:hypothetical protein
MQTKFDEFKEFRRNPLEILGERYWSDTYAILSLLELSLHINAKLNRIEERLNNMADTIVTRDQFDAALAKGIATIEKGFSDLLAKIAAGQVTTPEDFTAELNTLQEGLTAALTADPDADGSLENPPADTANAPAS